ncbi:gastrula zinc finger protein XlCGF8.2DB-like isoform X1 [Malaya genurostris]|uniref:gastrula zinc finger protein XlCGF8.2DB-like isoform X1 n=2 Tax=Malaya genurostris TaxID=325434 RepID=UPI0026F384EB|nr:gastrula zinc finger protein XlCGF8.2DB-like isoform X1 [Malaya genurostris]
MQCRTCLSTMGVKCRSLFKVSLICGVKRRYSDLLIEIIPNLKIEEFDGLPDKICNKCCLTLKHFMRFRHQCLKSDKQLRTMPWIETNKAVTTVPELIQGSSTGSNDKCNGIIIARTASLTSDNNSVLPHNKRFDEDNKLDNNEPIEQESFTVHDESNPTQNFECRYCHKVLSTRKSLRCHMQLHSTEASFLCNFCGEQFKTKMAYTGHMAIHDPNKFRCDVCGKSYRQAASLRSHQLNHNREKPFSCTICGHATTQRSGLKKHMLTHSDAKSYVCDLCGEHFRFSSNLIMHKRRRHLHQKNFACSQCSKEFISKDELLNHSMCHSNERPFDCGICGNTFNRKSSLKFHQKHKHSVMAKIACQVCGRGFSQKVSLQNHLRMHMLTD